MGKTLVIKGQSTEEKILLNSLVDNVSLIRERLLNKLIDSRRDIDLECGYPKELTIEQYQMMYDREGIATRVVQVWPEESWADDPEVLETEDPTETEFERVFKEVEKKVQLWAKLAIADEISGIGRFGVLLLGFGDGKEFSEPVEGINDKEEKVGNAQHELFYVRPLGEAQVRVQEVETNQSNPRYGKPKLYAVAFEKSAEQRTGQPGITTRSSKEVLVHWTRIIHIADNRKESETFGVPRMQSLFNRLYDLRKITGGSGEMFWKGGFPGYSFEMDPQARPLTTTQKAALKEEIRQFADGLQRYMTVQGVSAKSLTSQVADPRGHIDVQFSMISVVLGIPKRVLMGSEQSQLASSQDTKRWNKRVEKRQKKYLNPFVIRPTIDRLIALGVLPEVEEYKVVWPDLDVPSAGDKAAVLKDLVDALAKYQGGNVESLIPPEIFLSMFMDLDEDQVKKIMEAAEQRIQELDEEEAAMHEEEMKDQERLLKAQGRQPQPQPGQRPGMQQRQLPPTPPSRRR